MAGAGDGAVVVVVEGAVVVVDDPTVVVVVDEGAVVVVVDEGAVVVVEEGGAVVVVEDGTVVVVVVVEDAVVVVVDSSAAPAVPDGSRDSTRVTETKRLPATTPDETASAIPPPCTLLPRSLRSAKRFAIGVRPYFTKRGRQDPNRPSFVEPRVPDPAQLGVEPRVRINPMYPWALLGRVADCLDHRRVGNEGLDQGLGRHPGLDREGEQPDQL